MPIAYKLFKIKDDKLYPLYVLANKETPLNTWLEAECGEMQNGKVKSKLGLLCYRAGWHLSSIPLVVHIGMKENGVVKYMHPDTVWCECEYDDTIDYQEIVNQNGMIDGKFNAVKAYMQDVPHNGFYRYKTNPQMLGEWIISGRIKVNKILTDEEVAEICQQKGYEPQPRKVS